MTTPPSKRPLPVYKPGDPVVLWQDSANPRCSKEYGRVIDRFWEPVVECWEYWVAFFGHKMPSREMMGLKKPYVLRYLECSLRNPTPRKKK